MCSSAWWTRATPWLDLTKTAAHIIDLGPEGGNRGGTIVAQGTPEQVAQVAESYTGQYLRPLLGK